MSRSQLAVRVRASAASDGVVPQATVGGAHTRARPARAAAAPAWARRLGIGELRAGCACADRALAAPQLPARRTRSRSGSTVRCAPPQRRAAAGGDPLCKDQPRADSAPVFAPAFRSGGQGVPTARASGCSRAATYRLRPHRPPRHARHAGARRRGGCCDQRPDRRQLHEVRRRVRRCSPAEGLLLLPGCMLPRGCCCC